MSDYTLCVALTWQIAAEEAATAKQEQIEPEHLFIGLCKLVGFTQPDELRRLGLPEVEAAPVKAEIDLMANLFARFSIDPIGLRRELRERKNAGLLSGLNKLFERPREGRIIHRSPQTRQVFTRASEIANQANASMTTVTHLLAALVDHPNLAVAAWLRRKSVDVVMLKQAALDAPVPQTPVAPPLAAPRATQPMFPTQPGRPTSGFTTPKPTVDFGPANAPGASAPGTSGAGGGRVYTTHSIVMAPSTSDEALAQAQRHLRSMTAISQALSAATSLSRLLRVIAEQLAQALPKAQSGSIVLPDEHGEMLLQDHWPAGSPVLHPDLLKQAHEARYAVVWNAPTDAAAPEASLSAMYVPLLWGDEVLGVVGVHNRQQREAFTQDDLDLLTTAATQAALFLKQQATQHALKRQEAMRHSLLRQFSPKVAELLTERGHLRLTQEVGKPITLLVATFRGFASLTTSLGAEGAMQALDEIFSVIVPILSAYNGTLDRNTGEMFVGIFEAQPKLTPPWERAAHAAHEMQRTVQRLENEWSRRGWLACDLAIGLHLGEIIAGADSGAANASYPTLDELVDQTKPYSEAAQRGEVMLSQSAYARLYNLADVAPRIIHPRAANVHPDLNGYVIKRLKEQDVAPLFDATA